jgi:hypothetical protein
MELEEYRTRAMFRADRKAEQAQLAELADYKAQMADYKAQMASYKAQLADREAQLERAEKVFALLRQGYSLAEAEKKLGLNL